MKTTVTRCPVPAEQVPIREYEEIRESWFYSWGGRHLRGYLTPLLVIWCLSWLVTGPIAAASFSPERAFPQFFITASAGALILPALALLQLYIGWSYVGNRLRQQAVPYEESGWYDGQVWVKPDDVLSRDRLIVDYQIKPVLKRMQKTFGVLGGLLLLTVIGWQFL
jgi:hypothetical protein